jgi:hypothetical protein
VIAVCGLSLSLARSRSCHATKPVLINRGGNEGEEIVIKMLLKTLSLSLSRPATVFFRVCGLWFFFVTLPGVAASLSLSRWRNMRWTGVCDSWSMRFIVDQISNSK